MNEKPKLIIFEGVDKVGKTTVYQAFRKATTYGPLCIDRFIGSNFVYDTFFRRKSDYIDIKNCLQLEEKLMGDFDCILVYLTCEEDILIKRIKDHDKKSLELEPIKRTREVDLLFYFYYKVSGFRKIIIDTSRRDVGRVVYIIIEFMNGNSANREVFFSDKWKVALGTTMMKEVFFPDK